MNGSDTPSPDQTMRPAAANQADIAIRPYRTSDRAKVLALELAPGQERWLARPDELVAALDAKPRSLIFVIERGGCFAGLAALDPCPGVPAGIVVDWFAVDRKHQGAGLGRLVLSALVRRAARMSGRRRIRLKIEPSNSPAERLYSRLGFRRTGETDAEGDLWMERPLSEGSRVVHAARRASVLRLACDLRVSPKRARRTKPPGAAPIYAVAAGPAFRPPPPVQLSR